MRRPWLVASLLLLVAVSAHALADTHVGDARVERLTVPLDRAYDETFVWRANVKAVSFSKIEPRLAFAGEPAGDTADGAQQPRVEARMLVDGVERWHGGHAGAVVTWSGTIEIGTCRPRGSCATPPIAAGFGAREVVFEARVVNEPQARAGAYRLTLGPLDVEADRGPWIP